MFLIYDRSNNNKIVEVVRYRPYSVKKHYKSMAAARAALTRMSNKYAKEAGQKMPGTFRNNPEYSIDKDPQFIYGIAEVEYYHERLEKKVERKNLVTGETYFESVNTPYYCSPSSETYWSS